LALALPLFLAIVVGWAVGWQIHLAIPFSAEQGPVEWLDTALLTLLTAVTFGIGLFQRGRRRLAWWTAALGLGLVMILSLADFFPDIVPDIDNDDYPMLGGWAAAAGIILIAGRSAVAAPPARLAAGIGFLFHTGALVFDLLDDYLLPSAPGMAAGFVAAREIVELLYLGAYCCAAGLTVGRVVTDAFGEPGARRAGLAVPLVLERWIGGWFKNPAGRMLRIAVEDARWRGWQNDNPGRSFADYYAQQISRSLAAGQPHRTLGMAAYSDRTLISGSGKWSADGFAGRGFGKFALLREWHLRADERVIDYGCGSLRVGQHLIRYLDRGNYIGLDITDAFYRDGVQMLEPGLVDAKAPYLALIDEASIDRLARHPPDVVLSVAVAMHVPPEELDWFFNRILRLVGPRTRAMIHVDVAVRALRTAPKSWAYPASRYERLVGALRPDLDFNLALGKVKGRLNGIEWRHGILTLQPAIKN
jgi:SAM-dependent methyltransferase